MCHKAAWIGNQIRIKLSRESLQDQLTNHYITSGAYHMYLICMNKED